MDHIIAERGQLGLEGAVLGWVFEVRARVAAWMGDEATFERHAQLCARRSRRAKANRRSPPSTSA